MENSPENTADNPSAKSKWPVGLNREIFLLGLVSMLADVSSEMLTPVTPIFLTSVLGASAASVGIVEGIAEATASLLKALSGLWSDRIRRRKPFIVAGYFLAALSKPLIGLSHSWAQVLSARAIDRIGKGIRTAPRDALLADSISSDKRARAFGWHRALDTTGAVIGPLLALILMYLLAGNLRAVYFFAFFPGLISVVLALLVHEKKPHTQAFDSSLGQAEVKESVRPKLSARFKFYILLWTLFSIGNSSDAFLILRTHNIGFSIQQTVLIYCLYNIIYAASSPFLGGLADRFGKRGVLGGGLAVFTCVYAGFAWAHEPWHLVILFAVYGIYAAATDGVGKALAVDYLPATARGYGLGLFGTITGFAILAASIIAGWLWDTYSPTTAFFFGAATAALSGIGLLLLPAFSAEIRQGRP